MIALVDPDIRFRAAFADTLGRGGSVVELEGLPELDSLAREREDILEVAILGPNLGLPDALHAADALQMRFPNVSVLLVVRGISPEVLHQALRSGIKDVLPTAATAEQVRESVARAESIARQVRGRLGSREASRPAPGKVVTVFSSKGGSGKSVVASNLAVLLAQMTGQPVGLVDLDLQSGDMAIMLGMLPAWTIYDAADHVDRLDADALRGYLTPHRSGVQLLAAPLEPSLAEAVSPKAVHQILLILKEMFRHVVVDGPASFTDQILAALDESDECLLVASMDVPSIKNLKMSLQTLEQLGYSRQRIRIVLNRADSKVGLSVSEVERTLRTPIDAAIPSSREVPLSVNQGTPLVGERSKSPVIKGLSALAEAVRLRADGTAPPRGSFPDLGSRKKAKE